MPRTKSVSKVIYYLTALFYRDFFFFSFETTHAGVANLSNRSFTEQNNKQSE